MQVNQTVRKISGAWWEQGEILEISDGKVLVSYGVLLGSTKTGAIRKLEPVWLDLSEVEPCPA